MTRADAVADWTAVNPGHPWGTTLREPRMGCMVHYDASASDAGALAWLRSPACRVSYTYIVLDNGIVVPHAPLDARAWHAGRCRSSDPTLLPYTDANSAFYGVAVAATVGDRATTVQVEMVAALCLSLFSRHEWARTDWWRIVGHNTECWPRGRKIDPVGPDPARPVLSVTRVRAIVAGGVA